MSCILRRLMQKLFAKRAEGHYGSVLCDKKLKQKKQTVSKHPGVQRWKEHMASGVDAQHKGVMHRKSGNVH